MMVANQAYLTETLQVCSQQKYFDIAQNKDIRLSMYVECLNKLKQSKHVCYLVSINVHFHLN